MSKKDGFTGSLQIGDKLFPESIELGLGDTVTAQNIDELTSIFTTEAILTAVADSIATGQPVTVTLSSLDAIDAAVDFLKQRFFDVDYDRIGCSITIFGDDQRIEGNEEAGLWVLNLIFAPAPARFTY